MCFQMIASKALFVIKSARVHVFCSLSTVRAHFLELCGPLPIKRPQDLHSHIFPLVCPFANIGAPSGCVRQIGESYCVRIYPTREREVLTAARESRDRGKYF